MKSNCSSSNTAAPRHARSLSKRIPSGKGLNKVLLWKNATRAQKMGHIRFSWEALNVSCAAAHGRDDTVLLSPKSLSGDNGLRKSSIFPIYFKRWVNAYNVLIVEPQLGTRTRSTSSTGRVVVGQRRHSYVDGRWDEGQCYISKRLDTFDQICRWVRSMGWGGL